MIIIHGKNVNTLFVNIAKALKLYGIMSSPRGLNTIEIQDAILKLDNINDEGICSLPERNINRMYLYGELQWYNSGSYDVNDIAKHSTFWSKLANTNGTVNSNYGAITFKDVYNGKSQYEWCLAQLQKDSNSRQAVINLNQPKHKYDNNKDFVCAMYQQFRINDNKLDTFVAIRSNDFIYGLTYDIPWFIYVQQKLARDLDIECGKYTHVANSLHVYERHFEMLDNIANVTIEGESQIWNL